MQYEDRVDNYHQTLGTLVLIVALRLKKNQKKTCRLTARRSIWNEASCGGEKFHGNLARKSQADQLLITEPEPAVWVFTKQSSIRVEGQHREEKSKVSNCLLRHG